MILIDGEWCPQQDGSYALKVGRLFLGQIKQRGGDGIYATCWIVSLNQTYLGETPDDPDYAKGWVEREICEELEFLRPILKKVFLRAPPSECFVGTDSYINWRNWKEDRAVEGWTFTKRKEKP